MPLSHQKTTSASASSQFDGRVSRVLVTQLVVHCFICVKKFHFFKKLWLFVNVNMVQKNMKVPTKIILFLSIHLTSAQLNFEGNPLTENTEYLAEESHISERSSRQRNFENSINNRDINQITSKEIKQPITPQKLYPVYSNNVPNVLQNTSEEKTVPSSELVQNSKPVQSSNPIQITDAVQVLKLVPTMTSKETSRQLQENFINTNVVQQEQNPVQRISPADLALKIFMNSKTPQESELALKYYLQGGQGLTEQLEIQKQQQIREKELQQEQYFRQQQIQQEQMIQKQIQQEQMIQKQMQQEQMIQKQIKQEQLIQKQKQQQLKQEQLLLQVQQEQLHEQKAQLELDHLNQEHLFNQHIHPSQIQGHQFQNLQQIQPQIQGQNQFQNQMIHSQIQQAEPLQSLQPSVTANQLPGYYPYSAPRIPLIQSRNDFPGFPVYRRPMRRTSYRQPVSIQSRMGPIYKGPPPPPTYPGKMMKPPVEVIYSRPPSYARGAPIVSSSPVFYEDANPWFAESDHKPPPKDIYYSQLYAQSYDPHYYNYIAKTGKIKPHLYGKLNGEEKENGGILAELFRGFTKHGMKNIMNPTFLLGMTIPALTFMLTALVQKRSLARSDSRSLNEDEIREYLERLKRALECYRNMKVPTDDRCWR